MKKGVCRAITFINYHMPICTNIDVQPQYSTIGYFDGMYTEKINVDYEKDDLQAMWKYTLRKTAENKGYYSFQNVFGISDDAWNDYEDDYFWNLETNEKYPLTFVVFLQLSNYMKETDGIKRQCQEFNTVLKSALENNGISYTYGTIDKNDFIVCIKSRHYKKTVSAIKAIHNAGKSVVYSYSIFSVHKDVLEKMSSEQYPFLYNEEIDSICLKGITNSMDTNYGCGATLDQKYRQFCDELMRKLYADDANKEPIQEDGSKKLYDILGDNDFRLIARNVSLGKLLGEYAPGGILCYAEDFFPYYFFSSSMVLNTLTGNQNPISREHRIEAYRWMQKQQETPFCDKLLLEMVHIKEAVQSESTCSDLRVKTFCQAMFQLLQSLKVLEAAPTKKYDFYSLYYPFAMLVHILEAKLSEGIRVGEHAEVFEFIHKISMTLHGTLRTDIQFFQIKDFNAIVHYAPAKLRAYYALWVLKLSDYYNKFSENEHAYSFVVAPGMFKGTGVQQLFTEYGEKKRLMLITVPERHIYSPKWLTIILVHEVQHVVGTYIRRRQSRHMIWLKMTARVLELELLSFFYVGTGELNPQWIERLIKDSPKGLLQIERQLLIEEKEVRRQNGEDRFEFHWERSRHTIHGAYRRLLNFYMKPIVFDYCSEVKDELLEKIKTGECMIKAKSEVPYLIGDLVNKISEEMLDFCKLFEGDGLEEILKIIRYISGESLADMTAIFSLSLSPKCYVESFGKMEVNDCFIDDVEEASLPLLPLRIALVMNAVSETLERHKDWIKQDDSEFYDMWHGDVLHKTAAATDCMSLEGKIIKWACDYYDYRFDFVEKISAYERIYSTEKKGFSNTKAGFLNDKEIWNLFQEYLGNCADAYLERLEQNKDIQETRGKIIYSYQKIARNSIVDLMQEIDIFLEQNEK